MANARIGLTLGVVVLRLLAAMFGLDWLVARTGMGAAFDPASLPDLEREFTERMQNVALVGRFTFAGQEDRQARPERYEIRSVEKIGDDATYAWTRSSA